MCRGQLGFGRSGVSKFLGLAYPKLTIDQDRLALSVDQGRRHVPAICLADEYVEVERFGWRRKYGM